MKTSTKIHYLRALVACGMFGIFAIFYHFPDFVVPGLIILIVLIGVQLKLWQLLSQAIITEANQSSSGVGAISEA